MVRAGWIVVLLVTCGWVACEWETPSPRAAQVSATEWRRAKGGWEWTLEWESPWQRFEPKLHPAVVVSFLSCASLLALLGLPMRSGRTMKTSVESSGASRGPNVRRPRASSLQANAGK